MPFDPTEAIESLERSLGQVPAALLAVVFLAGPTLAWLLYRFVVQPRTSRYVGGQTDLYWVCEACRSANEVRAARCYRCGLDHRAIEGDLQVVDVDELVTLAPDVVAAQTDGPGTGLPLTPLVFPPPPDAPPPMADAPPPQAVPVGPGRHSGTGGRAPVPVMDAEAIAPKPASTRRASTKRSTGTTNGGTKAATAKPTAAKPAAAKRAPAKRPPAPRPADPDPSPSSVAVADAPVDDTASDVPTEPVR